MERLYQVRMVGCEWRERQGFVLDRPHGTDDFLFLHFLTPVRFLQDGELLDLPPGACILTPPGTRHWFESPDCALVHNWVHFIPADRATLLALDIPQRPFFLPETRFISRLLGECSAECINREPYWEEQASCLLGSLLLSVARACKLEHTAAGSAYLAGQKEKFDRFRQRLYRQAGQPWDVAGMAAALHLSRSRFSVLYQRFYHVSPAADLIAARIAYAKYLLGTGTGKVAAVAQMAGYQNVSHFCRQFKKMTGQPPSAYLAEPLPPAGGRKGER